MTNNNDKEQKKYISTLYPLINNYDCDISKISLNETYCFTNTKKYTIKKHIVDYNSESDDEKYNPGTINMSADSTNMNIAVYNTVEEKNIGYDAYYEYNKIGTKKLCILTGFMKIRMVSSTNFSVDISDINENNLALKNLVDSVVNKIGNEITKIHPGINVKYPYKDSLIYVSLMTKNNNKIVTTTAHIHKTKKNGGGTITIENNTQGDFCNKIKQEFPGIVSATNKNNNIFFVARMSLVFSATVNTKRKFCKIKIFAKELEIKYNVSHVASIFNRDITVVTYNENKQITKLEL